MATIEQLRALYLDKAQDAPAAKPAQAKAPQLAQAANNTSWPWTQDEVKHVQSHWDVISSGMTASKINVTDLRAKTGLHKGMLLSEMAVSQRLFLRNLYLTAIQSPCVKVMIEAMLGEDAAVIKEKAE